MKVPLTNSSEYLAAKNNISEEEIHSFMQKELALILDDNDAQSFRLQSIEDKNQERLDIAKFSLEVRQKLMENKQFFQAFIMAKMKCFDYLIEISTYLVLIVLELSSDAKGEIIAKSLKKQLDDVRDNVENILSKQLAINPEAFPDYCKNIMNKMYKGKFIFLPSLKRGLLYFFCNELVLVLVF